MAFALSACLTAIPASAAVITFVPSAQHVNVGDVVTVDVNISGLGAEILRSFDVDLFFDEATLNNFAVTHSAIPHMGGLGNATFDTDFLVGRTQVKDATQLTDAGLLGQPDDFTIIVFSFQAVADGASVLAFGLNADERQFLGLNDLPLQVDIGSTCISVGAGQCVAAVPEPASIALVGMALAGMLVAVATRRRRSGRA